MCLSSWWTDVTFFESREARLNLMWQSLMNTLLKNICSMGNFRWRNSWKLCWSYINHCEVRANLITQTTKISWNHCSRIQWTHCFWFMWKPTVQPWWQRERASESRSGWASDRASDRSTDEPVTKRDIAWANEQRTSACLVKAVMSQILNREDLTENGGGGLWWKRR